MTLPGTTGTAASLPQRLSRYGSEVACQTVDPHSDGPEKNIATK